MPRNRGLAGNERVAWRSDDNVRVRSEHRFFHREAVRRTAHDGDIDFIVPQRLCGFRAVANEQLQLYLRVPFREGRNDARRIIFGCTDDADGNASSGEPLYRAQLLAAVSEERFHSRGRFDQPKARIGWPQPNSRAMEKTNPQTVFKQFKLL